MARIISKDVSVFLVQFEDQQERQTWANYVLLSNEPHKEAFHLYFFDEELVMNIFLDNACNWYLKIKYLPVFKMLYGIED